MIKGLFRSRSKTGFRARSSERDAGSDREAVMSIVLALDVVLAKAEAERTGLKNRLDHVIALAAIVGGNDGDDRLTRSNDRINMLRDSDSEIRRGQERLSTLDQNIAHFEFLRSALQTRFPNVSS